MIVIDSDFCVTLEQLPIKDQNLRIELATETYQAAN